MSTCCFCKLIRGFYYIFNKGIQNPPRLFIGMNWKQRITFPSVFAVVPKFLVCADMEVFYRHLYYQWSTSKNHTTMGTFSNIFFKCSIAQTKASTVLELSECHFFFWRDRSCAGGCLCLKYLLSDGHVIRERLPAFGTLVFCLFSAQWVF